MSDTLFAIKINSLASVIPEDIFTSMFVDDLLIAYAEHSQMELERKLQGAVNTISKWAERNCFNFSAKKTEVMQIYKIIAPAYKTEIKMKNRKVLICPAARFLGLQWDSK